MYIPFLLFSLLMNDPVPFKQTQLQHSRVSSSYQEKEITVKKYFSNKNLNYQGFHLFIRAFKKEQKLEVWIRENGKLKYTLLQEYDFCTSSGVLGPKRKEGDRQIPEGIYHISHFNPFSNFYLSLGINYPNRSDRILGDKHPGSAIYIHGSCVTIGCIPLTDDKIKELYILAVEARNNGQATIPVHIFPARFTMQGQKELENAYAENTSLLSFWSKLRVIYDSFEKSKTIPEVRINSKGEYYL